jgi:putative oxidoreductase
MTAITADIRHRNASQDRLANIADLAARHAHWLPRIAFASVFLFHGVGKLVDVNGFASMMGLPLMAAWLVTFAELAGGLAVLVGPLLHRDWITRLGGLAGVPVLIGAIAMVHWGRWSFVPSDSHPMGGMEFQVVLLLMALWFTAVGNRNPRKSS